MENNSSFETFELQLTNEAKDFLKETGKWASFLGILGFIGLAFFVIIALTVLAVGGAMSSAMDSMGAFGGVGTTAIGIIYLLMALLYFFPVLYLYRFGSRIKNAFANNDTAMLTSAIENLKSHYKFVGILAIIMIAFYVLAIVFGVLGAFMS